MKINSSYINVYKKNNKKSEVVTQLLYGDRFKKIKKIGPWLKIKNDKDKYIGYIKNKKYLPNKQNTHKVSCLAANLYSSPEKKYKIKNKLSFESKITVIFKKNNFYKFENLWIKKNDLEKINFISKDPFRNIKKFLNVKYKWGGKHFTGIDCSALVQLFLNYNNRFCPRDSGDQKKYFKKKIKLKNIKKNDLIFWTGHVAIAISKNKLIHAYGPFKKIVVMEINKTIDKIYKSANLKITGIRRI